MKKIYTLFSTLFGVGYFPVAPGTAGTLFAAILYFLLPVDLQKISFTEFFIIIISLGLSIPIISKAEENMTHDDKRIVLDEFFGYLVSVLFFKKTILIIVFAFIFFRIFDIFKPEPVNSLQKLPKGLGVMMDDIFAGVYANVTIRIILYIMSLVGFYKF